MLFQENVYSFQWDIVNIGCSPILSVPVTAEYSSSEYHLLGKGIAIHMPIEPAEFYEREIRNFRRLFPGLDARFCRIMGRRVSHLAGDTSEVRTDELRLPVGTDLLLFVSGRWKEWETDLRIYASELGSLQDSG